MITVRLVHGGQDRYQYFADDIDMHLADTRQADYYLAGGRPKQWLGSGMPLLRENHVPISQETFCALFEDGSHPMTGDPLGRPFPKTMTLEDRIAKRVDTEIPRSASGEDRQAQVEAITKDEEAKDIRKPVSAFEMVFNPPKSVSAVWAVADATEKAKIADAHQAALQYTIDVMERDYVRTRIGTDGVAQADTGGVVAAAFDHVDTRNGDPQLHTHVMVANRVQGPDGKWRTLDSRNALMPGIVTLSATYDSALRDEMTARFGVSWTIQQVSARPEQFAAWLEREHVADSPAMREQFALQELHLTRKTIKWELEGVPNALIAQWSTRVVEVEEKKDEYVAKFEERHGHTPSTAQILRWKARQALRTRKAKSKEPQPLAEQSKRWRKEAEPLIGNGFAFADRILSGEIRGRDPLRHDDIFTEDDITYLGEQVASELQDSTTWRRSNAIAAAHRVLGPYQFRTPEDREDVALRIAAEAVNAHAVQLTVRTGRRTVEQFTSADGSAFEPESRDLYTTQAIWDAETHLLAGADAVTAPTHIPLPAVPDHDLVEGEHPLSPDQRAAVETILSSGRIADVLVGPAGAGKTTSLAELRRQWEAQHGAGSVVGLAPSAAAAKVLGTELGITTENTAKWLTESTRTLKQTTHESHDRWLQRRGEHAERWAIKPGQLVIVDEAGMSGTLALNELLTQCENAGAKLLLVGDHEQLSAVDAGGAFGMIVRHLPDHAELDSVWRFDAAWEAAASTMLREGRKSGLKPYLAHDRIGRGTTDEVLDQAFTAWQADIVAGKTSLLMAADNDQVAVLNTRAQQWRQGRKELGRQPVTIAGDQNAFEGDLVVTRQNDRTILTGDGFIRNGAVFTVVKAGRDGALTVRDEETQTDVTLPAEYVREHVELAYASTVHRAQGRTVDTSHSIVDGSMNRGAFYVAMTRGRESNRAYVDVTPDEILEGDINPGMQSYIHVLDRIMETAPEEASAHESAGAERDRLSGTMQLVNEYETLSGVENHRYADQVFATLGLDLEDTASRRALVDYLATMRSADLNPQAILQDILDTHDVAAEKDLAGFLRRELAHAVPGGIRPRRIAGLTEEAPPTPDIELARVLGDRERALQARAEDVLAAATEHGAIWVRQLGEPMPGRESEWQQAALTIAAYRDKWGIRDDETILATPAASIRQRRDQRIAERAQKIAKATTGDTTTSASKPDLAAQHQSLSTPTPDAPVAGQEPAL